MKKIILNWMPPSMVEMPSPSMSVLKKFLSVNGYDVSIVYWNLKLFKLQNEFLWSSVPLPYGNEFYSNLIFLNYLAVKSDDSEAYAKVKSVLIALKPGYLAIDAGQFDRHIKYYAELLDKFIDDELAKIDIEDTLFFGMSVSLYQWIGATIIAKKIKQIAPQVPIAVGGIGTKESACAYLDNFPQFDIAMWGEGEHAVCELARCLQADTLTQEIDNIANVAYRSASDGSIVTSTKRKCSYIDLNQTEYYPDFDDYFEQLKDIDGDSIKSRLFIEGSRGCHWRKCYFCYLNTGYKHRLRSADKISKYIREMIDKYKIFEFEFLDNDIISNDWERFDILLGELMRIREDYPKFKIVLVEIITKGITAEYIRKMALAGIEHVQFGYESPSNELLRKIDKKNTFASNLLFIKFADKFDIGISGANIIKGLLEETYEDVLEGIENLRFMRFFLKHGKFRHNMSCLGVSSSSRYFESVKGNPTYILGKIEDTLPLGYLNEAELCNFKITEGNSILSKRTWEYFVIAENFYIDNVYSYKLYDSGDAIMYKEFFNNEIVNELELDKKSLEMIILIKANRSILSLTELQEELKNHERFKNITDCEIFNAVEDLKKEGLIYTIPDYSEILTIIDIDNVI